MMKYVTALSVSLVAAWGLAGSSTPASAKHYYPGCNCGPKAPSRYYKTVRPAKFLTKYHDVSVTHRVPRVHQIVNVTRVQPVIHVHEVTRVHHHTVYETRNVYSHVTQHLAPIHTVSRSTQNFYDCRCGR